MINPLENHKVILRKFCTARSRLTCGKGIQFPKIWLNRRISGPHTEREAITAKPILCFRGNFLVHPYAKILLTTKAHTFGPYALVLKVRLAAERFIKWANLMIPPRIYAILKST